MLDRFYHEHQTLGKTTSGITETLDFRCGEQSRKQRLTCGVEYPRIAVKTTRRREPPYPLGPSSSQHTDESSSVTTCNPATTSVTLSGTATTSVDISDNM